MSDDVDSKAIAVGSDDEEGEEPDPLDPVPWGLDGSLKRAAKALWLLVITSRLMLSDALSRLGVLDEFSCGKAGDRRMCLCE